MEEIELKDQLLNEYNFMNSKKSKEFTEDFLSELGSELDNMFPGVSYVMSLRFKSQTSAEGKIDRILKRTDPKSKNIYDNIGLKIVVTHVSDKVQHANCQLVIEERERLNNKKREKEAYKKNVIIQLNKVLQARAKTLLDSIKLIDEKYYSNYKFMLELASETDTENSVNELRKVIGEIEKYIKKNQTKIKLSPQEQEMKNLKDALYKEQIKGKLELLKEIYENVEYERELYNMQDRECNNLFSQYMLEQIKNNSKTLKKFNISSIPERYRRHTGSKHYYVASHNSYRTNKKAKLQGWKIEMQVTSDYYNEDAMIGKAKHSEKDGKARILPNIPTTRKEYEEVIKSIVPETYVYINGTKTCKKCSEYEAFYLYYQEVIEGTEYLKNLEKCFNAYEFEEEQK